MQECFFSFQVCFQNISFPYITQHLSNSNGRSRKHRHMIKYGMDWSSKTCTGVIKHRVIKLHVLSLHILLRHVLLLHVLSLRPCFTYIHTQTHTHTHTYTHTYPDTTPITQPMTAFGKLKTNAYLHGRSRRTNCK